MKIKLAKGDGTVDAKVVRVVVAVRADPRKVRLVEVLLEGFDAPFEDACRVVFVEGAVEGQDLGLLGRWEGGVGYAFCGWG